MALSTVIPKAIPKTKSVDGFNGIWKYPIIPAVKSKGIMFGIIEIRMIVKDLNKNAISKAIEIIAKTKLCTKLIKRYLVPSAATTEVPVNVKS